MPLPPRPRLSEPIPNPLFSSPNENFIKGPYWNMKVGAGLSIDENGSLIVEGNPSTPPSSYLYGSNGLVGVGSGLFLSGESLGITT